MNQATLRTLLRRQLQEATADAWADADLNTLLDTACDIVGAKFFAMAPDRAPITTTLFAFQRDAGYMYATLALPAGFSRMEDVSLLQSDGSYLPIVKQERTIVEGLLTGSSAGWAYLGAGIVVGPAPVVSLVNGVRLRHLGGIALATAPATTPPFPSNLHMAVIYEAKVIALGETTDDDTPTRRALDKIYADAPGAYLDGGGEPESFSPDRRSSTQY